MENNGLSPPCTANTFLNDMGKQDIDSSQVISQSSDKNIEFNKLLLQNISPYK